MHRLADWYMNHGSVVGGAALAAAVAFLVRPARRWTDKAVQALLAALLTTGLFYGLECVFPECPDEAAVAIGAFVGFFGVDECKSLILSYLPDRFTRHHGRGPGNPAGEKRPPEDGPGA